MAGSDERVVIGAALVVGGGIAGIQASLDLADAGIKVYLLEREPVIGGKMAQLDKTFPTNDCSMCIISPKLAECGRHPNIEIITDADFLALEGDAGNFAARVRHRPRYVDLEICTSCDDCVQVCPVHVPSEFDEGLGERTAIHKRYAQAVPNAYAITKHGTSPCKNACPADTSAQGYIALISEGRYAEALDVIRQYNPFPATVGRVCHHPCESECNRGDLDSPVAICALKRFVADRVYETWDREASSEEEERELAPFAGSPAVLPDPDRCRVAVVGAGPAGLTASYFLARMGYKVTVFEALPVAGGMMRVGIPPYRLPREVLNREIEEILRLGVDLRLSAPVRDVNRLFADGYHAIFLAIGAHEPQKLGIPGEDAEGVLHGVPFLREVSLGGETALGERVLVVGGGNTAIDSARTALRLGSHEVILAYRRSRAEMPANDWEVDETEREGVKLEFLTQPVEVLSDDGRVVGVRCVRMELGEPGTDGRRRPIPIRGSEFVIPCDSMVAAVAQAPEISFLKEDHGLEITSRGTLAVDPQTMATNRPGIFAGGDSAAGPGALIEAIASGRRGALSIDRYLRGQPLLTPREELPLPVAELSQEEIGARVARREVDLTPRQAMPHASVEDRLRDFREVELGLTEEAARAEAARCLECGLCSECYQCVVACKPGAIDHQQAPWEEDLRVGAVILAPGYSLFDASSSEELGFGRYPNVVTAMQFERLLSASGPTRGHISRPSDGREPRRIAFLQCVGSRDQEHDYCSAVCCMYATKEAMLAQEHIPDVECQVFMMDMRAFGKGFEAYFRRGREKGVIYTRCRISSLKEDPGSKDILVRYQTEEGDLREESFDLVVLSVGMESPGKSVALAARVSLDHRGFCLSQPFHPVETDRPGVYVCGAFAGPKDIPDTVTQASGAAAAALCRIGTARGTQVQPREYPPEKELEPGEEPRIGAFICSCGSNIAGVVDVAEVVEYAKGLPGVVYVENTIYTCSADSLKRIQEAIREEGLNRVIVSSCTPRTHEPIFRDTIREAGLNPYLFEMANVRDQCSWVHSDDSEAATEKAKDLLRMSVARSRHLEPLHRESLSLFHSALVIGGGVAGMASALSLADQGFEVYLVEREERLGGRLRSIRRSVEGGDPQAYLRETIAAVRGHPKIEVLAGCQVVRSSGFVGNFGTTVRSLNDPAQRLIEHGVTIVATGGQEYQGPAYHLGEDPRILTQGDFEERLAGEGTLEGIRSVAMIQCVGPWNAGDQEEFYCSRICCDLALKNALRIKEVDPSIAVYVFFKDVRVYGFREEIHTRAREAGVIFARFRDGDEPAVRLEGGKLQLEARELNLGEQISLAPDLLVLSTAIMPSQGTRELSETLKVPLSQEEFFLEAHPKLRPVDFPSEGLFLCGTAQYPKLLDEAIGQALGAAARAATVLSQDNLMVGGVVAVVDEGKCVGCLTCVRVCPYDVPIINPAREGAGDILGVAEIEAAACQGCGICAGECPAKAIQLAHYRDEQIIAKALAVVREEVA